MLENAGIKIGQAIVKQAATTWLGLRKAKVERDAELTDLIKLGVKDLGPQRKFSRQLEEVADQIADRLEPLLHTEFRGLPTNERLAATDAVVDALDEASLDDELLMRSDLDPVKLARAVRDRVPSASRRAGLGEQASELFDRVLDESCVCLVNIIRQLPAFQPRATAEILSRLSELTRLVQELPRASLSGDQDDVGFTHRYLDYLSKTLDELELFGVDTRRYRARCSVSVAYLSLSVTDEAPDPHFAEGPDSQRVEQALARRPRTLLRGEAGSGKTTLLQWIAVNAARGSFTGSLNEWNGMIPFFVRLRAHAEGDLPQPEDMVRAIAKPISGEMPDGWASRVFRTRPLLLVDGVDELRSERRRHVRKWLSDLQHAYGGLTIVVTSRPSAAEARWLSREGFDSLRLEQMSHSDVTAFCRRWHQAIRETAHNGATLPCSPEELGEFESAVLLQLESRQHISALATTPLLCALLCALNLDRHKQLPPDRMKLYEQALELLLDRRDAEREVPAARTITLDAKTKITILQHLAWWLTLAGRSALRRDTALHQVTLAISRMPDVSGDADEVLRYLLERSGVIREPVQDEIDFVHRTFQEYLAAKQAAEEHHVDLLVQNAHNDQWRETVVMAAGHASLPIRTDLLNGLLDRAETEKRHSRRLRVVATACLDTAHSVEPSTTERVDANLAKLIPPRGKREVASLALAGSRLLGKLPSTLDSVASAAVAAACVRAVTFVNGPESLPLLASYATDPRHEVQRELQSAWKYYPARAYAAEVLAHAPLLDGYAIAEELDHVRHLGLLQHLIASDVRLRLGACLADLTFLKPVPRLVSLHFEPPSGDTVDLGPLREHPSLLMLSVFGHHPPAGLDVVALLPRLSRLDLMLRSLRDFPALPSDAPLNELLLNHCSDLRVTDGLAHLSNLKSLGLRYSDTDARLDHIAQLPHVERLFLFKISTDDNLSRLREVTPRLHALSVHDCRTVTDISVIENSPLRQLSLMGTPIADVRPLASLSELTELDLWDCRPDLDLTPLSELRQQLTLRIYRHPYRGLDKLGPNIKVKHR